MIKKEESEEETRKECVIVIKNKEETIIDCERELLSKRVDIIRTIPVNNPYTKRPDAQL